MARVLLRGVLTLLVSAFVGSLAVFVLLRMLRGDVATVILGETATPASLAALRAELGLDRPWYVQYGEWLGGFLTGDLGTSYAAGYDIAHEIASRLGLTVSLAVSSLVLSTLFALAAGTFAALHVDDLRGTAVDVGAQLGVAVPAFWAGLLLISLFAVELGWLPSGDYVPWTTDPLAAARSLLLPVVATSISVASILTRYVRSSMLEELDRDYVRTAMAKGMTRRRAAVTHGLRNTAVSMITIATLQLGALLAGTVVIENVFTLPGLGRMLLGAVQGREAVVVQSLVLVILLVILTLNLLLDLSYGLLDPRLRGRDGARRRSRRRAPVAPLSAGGG